MFIDKETGKIKLPSGLVITAELSKSEFEASAFFNQATPYDYGTLPFQWYKFEGGLVEEHILHIHLCFYSENIVSFHTSVNLHSTNPPKWEDWSLEAESQQKLFHDKLLQSILGNPHKKLRTLEKYVGLNYAVQYSYNWGKVWSGYDEKSGSSSIIVSYGSRLENALEDYRNNFQQ